MRCGYASPRARDQKSWPPALLATPWYQSVDGALAEWSEGDLCITGSFYLAGEALAAVSSPYVPG